MLLVSMVISVVVSVIILVTVYVYFLFFCFPMRFHMLFLLVTSTVCIILSICFIQTILHHTKQHSNASKSVHTLLPTTHPSHLSSYLLTTASRGRPGPRGRGRGGPRGRGRGGPRPSRGGSKW